MFGVLSLAAMFAFGFALGRADMGVVRLEDGRVLGMAEARRIAQDVDFDLFQEVWNLVQADYLRGPVSEKNLFYGAIDGLVKGVGDPYSDFFDPEEASQFESDLEGRFEGIGAEIGVRDEQLVIIAPLEDSPAARAGVQAGDRVYLIDGEDTRGMSVDEAVGRIRGPRGTTVVLTLSHDGLEAVEEVAIVRDVIKFSSVEYEMRDDGVAVIRVFFFNEDTARRFNEVLLDVLREAPSGVVLDLRNNPGGYLDRAVSVAGEWVGNEVVVIERNESGQESFGASGVARLRAMPTAVLVNGGSASASEIVAGALQDYELAIVVGTQTFGKGSVQDYKHFRDGSSIKLTVSEWLTPDGRSIEDDGITPDIIVEFDAEAYAKDGVDSQLEAAVEALGAR